MGSCTILKHQKFSKRKIAVYPLAKHLFLIQNSEKISFSHLLQASCSLVSDIGSVSLVTCHSLNCNFYLHSPYFWNETVGVFLKVFLGLKTYKCIVLLLKYENRYIASIVIRYPRKVYQRLRVFPNCFVNSFRNRKVIAILMILSTTYGPDCLLLN